MRNVGLPRGSEGASVTPMPKVIFLDVDGVLNCIRSFRRRVRRPRAAHPHYESVREINLLLSRSGADIVLSSTWRLGRSRRGSQRLMRALGIQGKIVGCTPCKPGEPRGDEIAAYLRRNKPCRYVIIDDDADMRHLKHRLVQTSFVTGFTKQHRLLAERMLA